MTGVMMAWMPGPCGPGIMFNRLAGQRWGLKAAAACLHRFTQMGLDQAQWPSSCSTRR